MFVSSHQSNGKEACCKPTGELPWHPPMHVTYVSMHAAVRCTVLLVLTRVIIPACGNSVKVMKYLDEHGPVKPKAAFKDVHYRAYLQTGQPRRGHAFSKFLSRCSIVAKQVITNVVAPLEGDDLSEINDLVKIAIPFCKEVRMWRGYPPPPTPHALLTMYTMPRRPSLRSPWLNADLLARYGRL